MTKINNAALTVWEGEKYIKLHAEGQLQRDRGLLVKALANKWFRLNTLYYIKDKSARKIRYRANKAQRQRFVDQHTRDLILKARQLGFTTAEMIDALDNCLFTPDFQAGCICHKIDDAIDIFDNKIRYAYENISSQWQEIFKKIGLAFPKPMSDKSLGYKFTNGSRIGVSTSYRGGTLQQLHVSEFGKICKLFPAKAREIVTGAFEAVGIGNKITLESTAEGQDGYFYEYAETSRHMLEQGKNPTEMDFRFHFFPWHEDPEYALDAEGVIIPQHLNDYFERLASKGIELTKPQKNWYAKKAETLNDDITREYPSYPEEAFAQSVEGAYYMLQMQAMRKGGRLTDKVHHNPSLSVVTGWDLGMSDSMVIWFAQIVGREIHVIDHYENSGEGLAHYCDVLLKKPYKYAAHYGPHDIAVRELGTGVSRLETASKHGVNFTVVPRISNHAEGIEAVRQFLPMCWIDESACSEGIKALDSFKKEWDVRLGKWKDTPRHDWASHGAKAFETLARAPLFEAVGISGSATKQSSTWGAHT